MNIHPQHYLADVLAITKHAGEAIMAVYASDFEVMHKADQSPLTQADMAAHHIIAQGLTRLNPALPVLSEESVALDFATRSAWPTYWLVDPLDGTKEFVKKNGEFTVNIALIHAHKPILGVVYAPVTNALYFATEQQGAYKQIGTLPPQPIYARTFQAHRISMAESRSHACAQTQAFFTKVATKLSQPEIISMGSSLKMCLVAEGVVDIYARFGPTSEWDTAAAHCVLNEAGGAITDTHGIDLQYNSKDSLLNPSFLAIADLQHDWTQYIENTT